MRMDRTRHQGRRRALVAAVCILSVAAANAQDPDDEAPPPPPKHLSGLSDEQLTFISDPAVLARFGLTAQKIDNILRSRGPEGAKKVVDSLISTLETAAYQPADELAPESAEPLEPAGDMAAIPLNTEAGGYNARMVLRPAIMDSVKREPGPFSLKRYMYETDGIPTFAGAPVALRKEDLVAGDVDVAFVAAPLNFSSGWRDAQHAPGVMRAMYGIGGYDIYAGVDPLLELTVADYGDLSVDYMSVELSMDHIRMMIGDMVEAGVIPFIVGGDHSIMFPSVAAMADQYGTETLGVVHLDAHYNGERDLERLYSDRQSVSRLIEEGLVKGENLIQVGVRDAALSDAALQWLRAEGVRYHTMAEVEKTGWDRVMRAVIREAGRGADNIFISFDISVLDPAHAPGAGRPAPGGLTMREAVPLVRRLCAETNVIGFEMLDVAPYLDFSYQTALNANYIMHACLTGIAIRGKGVKKENYLSRLTASDE